MVSVNVSKVVGVVVVDKAGADDGATVALDDGKVAPTAVESVEVSSQVSVVVWTAETVDDPAVVVGRTAVEFDGTETVAVRVMVDGDAPVLLGGVFGAAGVDDEVLENGADCYHTVVSLAS